MDFRAEAEVGVLPTTEFCHQAGVLKKIKNLIILDNSNSVRGEHVRPYCITHTDKTILTNKPDIDWVIWETEKPGSSDRNIDKPEKQTLTKYNPLADLRVKIHILRLVDIIPLIITAAGIANKSL